MIRWIDTAAQLDTLCDELSLATAYALDTEFHRERTYFARLALLQVAWADQVAVVDPLAVDVAPLARVFSGPGLMVAHAAEQDLEILERACGTGPARLIDTQLAAGFLGWSTPSLQTLLSDVLDVRMAKGDRLTDWMRRPLTDGQLKYAAADVADLVQLWGVLEADLDKRGRLEWVLDESRLLLERTRADSDPRKAWWRLKETRNLKGRNRAVAQCVAEWRELRARQVDLPLRFVLSDMALAGIVHRAPSKASDLADIRGLDARSLKGDAVSGLLEAVARGLAMSLDDVLQPPVDDVDRNQRPAVTLVTAWLGQLAQDLHIDPTLLATRGDVTALLRGDEDCRLSKGWRKPLLAEPIRLLVSGEAALAFNGHGGLVLESRSHQPIPDA